MNCDDTTNVKLKLTYGQINNNMNIVPGDYMTYNRMVVYREYTEQ